MKSLINWAVTLCIAVNALACVSGHSAETARPGSTQDAHNAADLDAPAPPAVLLNTSYPEAAGRSIAVQGGADAATRFQAALDQARPGDAIALEAGAEFTGNFTIPAKPGTTEGWLIIRSMALDRLAAGQRVSPAQATAMPRLISPNADAALKTAPGAHHVRIAGVEITTAPTVKTNFGLLLLGDGGKGQNDEAQVPHDLVVDRCYIHGNQAGDQRRGIALNSARTAVIDSYIAGCREVGADAQAICGWNGPGPFKIVDNYLEGSGENFMLGGSDPFIKDLVPSDIEFCRNTLTKPLTWKTGDPTYAGKHWSVKNLFELKNARRVIVEGNQMENCWVDGQVGFAVQLTPRNQDGGAPWSTVEDVMFANNMVRHAAGGVNILGTDNNHPSGQVRRITVRNNLFADIGGARWGGNGRFLQISETDTVTIDHNTVLHAGNIITAYGRPNLKFSFTNNLMAHNEYGVIGDGAGVGSATLGQYFPNCTFKKNVIAGAHGAAYPRDNFFPASLLEAGFTGGDIALSDSSPYRRAATDGKPIGCDPRALAGALRIGAPAGEGER